MNREDLEPFNCLSNADISAGLDSHLVYDKDDVDEFIDGLEKRITELESMPHTDNSAVIELLSDELEKLRPMEAALEIAEADNKKYIERINELEAENEKLGKCKEWMKRHLYCEEMLSLEKRGHEDTKRALWLMTAEWAEAMGLASCNIANKFMSRENFEVSDDYRNKTIKKYRHRQVVFCKYADYCRKKSEEYK